MKRLLCFLALITLMFVSGSGLSPFHRKANLMPKETLDDDMEEVDDNVVRSKMQQDIDIFISSPRGSALLAAVEENMDSIPGLYFPDGEKSLNEIRFDGWTKDDFFNNDYLCAFRRYMDAWLQGKEIDETEVDPSVLEPYRERLSVSGKFAVYALRPFLFGGLLYALISIDDPGLSLLVWIYSTVNDSHIDEYLVEHVEVHDLEEEKGELIDKDKARQYLLKPKNVIRHPYGYLEAS